MDTRIAIGLVVIGGAAHFLRSMNDVFREEIGGHSRGMVMKPWVPPSRDEIFRYSALTAAKWAAFGAAAAVETIRLLD